MKTQKIACLALFALLFTSFSLRAQSIDPNSYITIRVEQGQTLNFAFYNPNLSTEVQIVSGSAELQFSLMRSRTLYKSFVPQDTLVTLYGAFETFDCSSNHEAILAIDPSSCPTLENLNCSDNHISSLDVSQNLAINTLAFYNNPFTTQAYDDLICSLPDRVGQTPGRCFPLEHAESPDTAIYNLATSNNARMKSWLLRFANNSRVIPPTRGEYLCPSLPINDDNYITLHVQPNHPIQLHPAAITFATSVRIVSGALDTAFTVHADASSHLTVTPLADTLRFIGNLKILFCAEMGEAITGLTVHNSTLRFLDAHDNAVQFVNILHAPQLYHLELHNNQLSSLDASLIPQLNYLTLFNNPFNTQSFDEFFCTLPSQPSYINATAFLLENTNNSASILEASNTRNALQKHWSLEYFITTTPIPASHGDYQCELSILNSQQSNLTLYPNPAHHEIHLLNNTQPQQILIYDLHGRLLINQQVLHTLDVSSLAPGLYILSCNQRHTKLIIQ